ncbi:MAG: DegT/DnrJ/EryC1/StrS family aminotransferase [Methanocellales archaeon]|nr:DegT/DnrJ/EryC1/StrS family aminotransferase [Methanocellales archaeon]MDD3291877.1 DegT/DnrJ/EryC1/StrS family aminotransferase [Methanocellales archaeon]MDD5235520.1 DegT/DnrJ/EryC1/StrS family aminotransferase [Methanocellales archaeon]MDD5485139.1 DegT/DnrJ/EryC1/StrS family aminotransferase [Methanocellales archaeon]
MIPLAEPCLGEEELKNVLEAVKSGWISSKGKFIEDFERKFARYCEVDYGIVTSNGTVSLHLALEALEIKKGDEVIVPDLTFVAVANAVTYCNAKPIFIESHPDYWCIDPEKIEEKITKNTKAIIPVHLYGHPCYMDTIIDIAEDHNLYVVEDAAEAHGAEYKGKKVGSFGDVSCFSFYGNKIITTGEGGMCLTDNGDLAEKMKLLRDHGMDQNKRYWHDIVGFNYRMTNLQAAVGVAQLSKLDNFVEKKREIARWYIKELEDLADKGLITLHPEMPWAKCVYWMYCILVKDKFGVGRYDLIKKLGNKGIETRPFFYPMHVLPIYKSEGRYKVAEDLAKRGLNLPSSLKLREKEILYICKTIGELCNL